ncbi:hypothetical protein [Streptomyces fuscigenes]|nr:hypothetical protein [Streptomyces fuscigenes]
MDAEGFRPGRRAATVLRMDTTWLIAMAVVVATALVTGFIPGR